MTTRRLRPFALFALLLGLVLPFASQVAAQDIPPRSKLGPPPKGAGLLNWCQAQIAYRYGTYNMPTGMNLSTRKPVLAVDADLLFGKVEHCVQTGGTSY